ncbi:MAG: hypothetical protein A4E62_00590 [Syntrophorhabdus sp. PtaU1.Bin002]|nr:MAG: hypothetical protein A4E62_00590 [Syntrophorhabdus sp. PtaU1.Bin002]
MQEKHHMRIEKNKRRVTLCRSDGMKLDVNFFLSPYAEGHSGKELMLDVLNSNSAFLPVEDIHTGATFFLNKSEVMFLEIPERDLAEETVLNPQKSVQVELTNHEILNLSLFMEMPEDRSRVSDYLNFSPGFIYLCGKEKDIILNKSFVFSVKDL